MEIIAGMQGGFHSVLTLEAESIQGRELWPLSLTATISGSPVGNSSTTISWECNEQTARWERRDIWLFWTEDPLELGGQQVEVSARLSHPDVGEAVTVDARFLLSYRPQ